MAFLMVMARCFIKMEIIIEANGLMAKDKEEACKCTTKQILDMKDNGKTTIPMAKES